MSIADKITSIAGHLEDDYTALEQLGVSVEDRNIENIKDMANQIYAKFPKTSYAEGSNITLSNTLKGKLDFEKIYQEVEYIESDGNQFIDTKITGNNQFKIDATFKTKTVGISQAVFGYFSGKGNRSLYVYCSSGKQFQVGYGTWSNIDVLWQDNKLYNISLSNGKIIINGTEETLETASNFTTDYSLIIFKVSGSQGGGMPIQLYNFKMYDNNVLVRDFIPCYRISDNEIGLYDKVEGKFYTNAGTGTFTKGADVGNGFGDIVGYGDTSQEGTPTPDSPQEIEVVRGKNRFDKANYEQGYSYSTSGTKQANARWGIYYLPCLANETYTISGLKSYSNVGIVQLNSSKTLVSVLATRNSATTYTITSTQSGFIGISFVWSVEASQGSEIDTMQLEKGPQATSYLPYNTLEVKARGKNVVDWNNIPYTGQNGASVTKADSEYSVTCASSQFGFAQFTQENLKLKPNTNYIFRAKIKSTSVEAGSVIRINPYMSATGYEMYSNRATSENIAKITFTTPSIIPSNAAVGLYPYKANESAVYTDIMICEGTDDTYEPYYTPQIKQLSLGEYEFAKIGNYVDTIEYDVDEDKVYKNENIIKKAITSEMATQIIESADYGNYIVINPNVSIDMTSTTNNVMCNIAIPTSYDNRLQNVNNYRIFTNVSGNTIILRLPVGSSIDTLEEAKQLITNTNMYVIVKLATPTKTEITGTLKDQIKALYYSHSFTGTTILEIDGQLPLIIKVRALKGE